MPKPSKPKSTKTQQSDEIELDRLHVRIAKSGLCSRRAGTRSSVSQDVQNVIAAALGAAGLLR